MNSINLDPDIILSIRHLSKCLKQDFDNRLSTYGLTGAQGRVLFCINSCFKEGRIIKQSDIEKCFQRSKSSVSELINRMIDNNLIKRNKEKNGYSLIPTEKGQSIVNEIHNGKKYVIEKLLRGFDKSDIEKITEYINRMTQNIEGEENI